MSSYSKTAILSFIGLAATFCGICAGTSCSPQTASTPIPAPPPGCCLPATTTQFEPYQIIYQRFPANGPAETAWLVVWSEVPKKGLWIESAWFWRKPPFGWADAVQVLGRAGLSNIFVPYHNSDPSLPDPKNRFLDLLFGELLGAIPQDAGNCGTITDPLLPSTIDPVKISPRRVLIKEIRDRGVAWTSDRHTRRGEEMLLWATYDAGNYENVIQYGFRDDGTITFRLGNTGYVSPLMPREAHTHDALWYVDINLAGSAHNSVMLMKHVEPSGSWGASDPMTSFNGGFEGFADWNDKEFTHLNITNTLVKNAQGNNISYDLMPMRSGTSRHLEAFSQHDFWVTRCKPNELEYAFGFEGWNTMNYLKPPPESIIDTDVAVWYMSSNHHMPRDEDQEYAQPILLPGVALVMWSGFDLHPRNLFDNTPLHEPPCAMVPPNLVGWWPLDDLAGATSVAAIDDIGALVNANFGTPKPLGVGSTNGPAAVPGVVGGALSFDGKDDYVEIADKPALNFGAGDFSIDAWIKTTATAGITVILDKRQKKLPLPLQGYQLFTNNGTLYLQLAVGGSFQNYTSHAFIADGGWHHIAVAVNRTAIPRRITWYIDGNDVTTNPPDIPLHGSLKNSMPLCLGAQFLPLGGYWKGTIDELELFNRAIDGSEIFAIFAAGRNGKCAHP